MMINIIELEANIKQHEHYLMQRYPNTQELLTQLSAILDFGLKNEQVEDWLRLNKVSIRIVNELLEEMERDESTAD